MMWRRNSDNRGQCRGEAAETLAQQWLQKQGLRLIARNYRCKTGEIDLVMADNGAVVFVEVRYRRQHRFGSGVESVDWRKQRKIVQAARHFLLSHRQYADAPCRFDVLATGDNPGDGGPTWHWIRDAFTSA